jgi:hypothetical protein
VKWHADSRRGRFGSHAGAGVFAAGLSGRWRRLCPGVEVVGAGVPGQEAVQARAGEGFPAVATAFVEVGGEPANTPSHEFRILNRSVEYLVRLGLTVACGVRTGPVLRL